MRAKIKNPAPIKMDTRIQRGEVPCCRCMQVGTASDCRKFHLQKVPLFRAPHQRAARSRSTTIIMKDPGMTGGRLELVAADSGGGGPNLAETTNTRCVVGSSPMFRAPCAVCTFSTT